MQSMLNKVDALESQVRKMSADTRLNKAMMDCNVCGDKGQFGSDCPRWESKTAKREGAMVSFAMEAAKAEKLLGHRWHVHTCCQPGDTPTVRLAFSPATAGPV